MLDEEMDHIIRDAAENHHPPYNDKAWEKMEQKLDKHLPQQSDRRKWIFFLLFFLMLGAGFYFTINYFTANKKPTEDKDAVKEQAQSGTGSLPQTTATVPVQTPPPAHGALRAEQTQPPADNNEKGSDAGLTSSNRGSDSKTGATSGNPSQQDLKNSNSLNAGNDKRSTAVNKGKTKIKVTGADVFSEPGTQDKLATKNNHKTGKTKGKLDVIITGADAEENEAWNLASNSTGVKNQEDTKLVTPVKEGAGKDPAKVDKDEKEKELALTTDKKPSPTDKKKPKRNFAGNFGLTVSVGPELSFVSINKSGKATLMYGAGLSYDLAKRLTLRTGFYFSRKIYAATPDQYHDIIYPNLVDIDANCKVYEIPLSLSYNFGHRKNHNWFGNLGLSSFIMKNEYYDYNYKTPAGQTYNYIREISNENKHYFAVLSLSGGYKYQLNKRLSLQAEPYLKLPLSGIGVGKIKLNSTGVLFTVTVKPFAKIK